MATETTTAPPRRKETLESVVIRFAGDSGDGMQLTGTQFTNTSALAGNDLATFPDFPAEIRAPAGTLAGRVRLPGPLLVQRHLHARRRARRAGRDEPGGAQDQPRATSSTSGILIVNTDDVHRAATSRRRGYADEPARGRLARAATGSSRSTSPSSRARRSRTSGSTPSASRPLQELLRARHDATGSTTGRSTRTHARGSTSKFGEQAGARRGQHARAARPATTTARRPSSSRSRYEVPPAQARARHLPQHHGQQGARARASSPPPSAAGCRSSSAATRSRRRRDILHELSTYKNFGVITFQAEDEIAAIALGDRRRRSPARSAVTTTRGPGMALKARGDRPRGDDRAAAA